MQGIHCLVLRVQTFTKKQLAPLAQLVEQLTLNQRVPGSSPWWRTKACAGTGRESEKQTGAWPITQRLRACVLGQGLSAMETCPWQLFMTLRLVAHHLARWSSGQDSGLSRRQRGFDSRTSHHFQKHSLLRGCIYMYSAVLYWVRRCL